MNKDIAADAAQGRLAVINIVRLSGAIMVVAAMAVLNRPDWNIPAAFGYGLLVFGLFDFAVLPIWLARRWKSRNRPDHETIL